MDLSEFKEDLDRFCIKWNLYIPNEIEIEEPRINMNEVVCRSSYGCDHNGIYPIDHWDCKFSPD